MSHNRADKEEASKETASKEETSKEDASKEAASKEASKEEASKEAASKEEASKEALGAHGRVGLIIRRGGALGSMLWARTLPVRMVVKQHPPQRNCQGRQRL